MNHKLLSAIIAVTVASGLAIGQGEFLQSRPVDRVQHGPGSTAVQSGTAVAGNWSSLGKMLNKGDSKAPSLAEASATMLYGIVVDNNKGKTIPHGMYKFPASSTSTFTAVKTGDGFGNFGTYGDGKYYTMVYDVSTDTKSHWYTYDASTWQIESVVDKGRSNPELCNGMAFDPLTEKVYGIVNTSTGRWESYNLVVFDTDDWSYKSIAPTTSMFALAFDNKGNLYGVDDSGNFSKIDVKTGEATTIKNVGFTPAFAQSAAFDAVNNRYLWASFHIDESSSSLLSILYSIDPATGKMTLIKKFSSPIEITGMFIKNPLAADKAPAAMPAASLAYDNPGSLSCTISYTAPSKAYDGSTLAGNVDVLLMAGDDTIATQSVAPGANGSFHYTFPARGRYTIAARAVNDAGRGPRTLIKTYAGKDDPAASTGATLTIDDSNQATVAWTAPTQSVHGGYLDAENLKYDVYRFPDSVLVAHNIGSTTLSENVGSVMNNYSYKIIAKVDDNEGKPAWTNAVVHGQPFTPPYEEYFSNAYNFPLWTVIDANGDGNTFHYIGESQQDGYIQNSEGGDDWAISPAIMLDNQHVYKLSYALMPSFFNPQTFTVTCGTSNTAAAQGQVIEQLKDYTGSVPFQNHVDYFIPEASGKNHIGFHTVSEQALCNLDSIRLYEFAATAGPDSVTQLSATSTGGELKVKISMVTPTRTIAGASISSLGLKIYRDTVLIKTDDNVKAGTQYTFTDDAAKAGNNVYTIVPFNNAGDGWRTEVTRYAGYDIPGAVSHLKAVWTSDSNTVRLTWTAPTAGLHGGAIDLSKLTYTITTGDYDWDEKEVDSGVLETTYDADLTGNVSTTSGEWKTLKVKAVNEQGTSALTSTTIPMGKPYAAPWTMTWAWQREDLGKWKDEVLVDNDLGNCWYFDDGSFDETVQPYDNDRGDLLFCNRYSVLDVEAKCRFKSPVIDITALSNPVLSFYMYQNTKLPDDVWLIVEGTTNGSDYVAMSDTIRANANDGWTLVRVPLTKLKGLKRVGLSFLGHSDLGKSHYYFIDQVKLEDYLNNDLQAVSIKPSTTVAKAGREIELKAQVTNRGLNTASGYKVALYCNDKEVENVTGTELKTEQSFEHVFKKTFNTDECGQNYSYKVVVTAAGDENALNDTTPVATVFAQRNSALPAPTGLQAREQSNAIELTFNAPNTGNGQLPVTDSFEDYQPLAVDGIGEWKVYDADGQNTLAPNGVNDYAGEYKPNAYQVFNPTLLGLTDDMWKAKSGNQYLISFGGDGYYPSSPYNQQTPLADNWLISPLVKGGTEVSFFTMHMKADDASARVELLASKSGNNIDDFSLVRADSLDGANWAQHTFTLPADAKYFAIRFVATGQAVMMLDDVQYTRDASNLKIEGYNVYRNNEIVGRTSTTAYSDESAPAGSLTYTVTALYNEGESGHSNVAVVEPTGLESVNAALNGVKIVGGNQCVIIMGAVGRTVDVYTVAGTQAFAKANCASRETVNLSTGVYIVKVDGYTAAKVYVR